MKPEGAFDHVAGAVGGSVVGDGAGRGFRSWAQLTAFFTSALILAFPGRKSGRRYSTPVQLVIDSGERWLVAPYGEREWVKNARAAGEVRLTRAGRTARHRIEELSPDEAAPVLREYLRTTPIVKPYFDVDAEAPVDAFAAEAGRHPVFRLLDDANR